MKPVDPPATLASMPARPRDASQDAQGAASGGPMVARAPLPPPPHIVGLGAEDSWETQGVAAYREKTGVIFAKRMYNSDPDLASRRPESFVTRRKHQRSLTMPEPVTGFQAFCVRHTKSCSYPTPTQRDSKLTYRA